MKHILIALFSACALLALGCESTDCDECPSSNEAMAGQCPTDCPQGKTAPDSNCPTDCPMATDSKRIDSLNALDQAREAGEITDAEYNMRRNEIIGQY